jgi:hypothetical protein
MEKYFGIPGFEDSYEVSKSGKFRSKDRLLKNKWGPYLISGKDMPISINSNGYAVIRLSKAGKQKLAKVHRVLAILFLPNPENKRTVNHINGNKADYRLENLEWATDSENLKHAIRTGLMTPKRGEKNGNYGKIGRRNPNWGKGGILAVNSKIIIDTQTGIYYYGVKEAALAKDVNRHTLRAKLNGVMKNNTPLVYT